MRNGDNLRSNPSKIAKGLALTALILGILAAITAWIPVFGIVVAAAAIIFGALALKKRQSKGLGLTGLILGALAMVTAIAITISVTLLAGNLLAELEKMDSSNDPPELVLDDSGQADTGPEPEINVEVDFEITLDDEHTGDPIRWDALDTADAPLSPNSGTPDDPHAIGSRIVGAGLEIVINSIEIDAFERILELAPDNPAPDEGKRFVLVHLTMNNKNAEPLETTRVKIGYDAKGQYFPHLNRYLKTYPEPRLLAPNQQITGNFSGYISFRINQRAGEFLKIEHAAFPEAQYVELPR